jgi:GT2 family glycosyltransferase
MSGCAHSTQPPAATRTAAPTVHDRDDRHPAVCVVIPTRGRASYLEVALSSLMGQARAAGAEVVVVLDGACKAAEAVAVHHGARVVALEPPAGLNAARNAGAAAARAQLIAYLDDDVEVAAGWLDALLQGAASWPQVGVFGGPIRPRLEGGPRGCGREPAPISALDLGSADRDVQRVWGANMAIRRSALAKVGPFDERLHGRGDEEEWLERHVAAGGRVRYLAKAAVVHRRAGADARLGSLSRAAFFLGRSARRNDLRKGSAPALGAEARVLAGCIWHAARRRCPYGIVMAAHTAGRLREALTGAPRGPVEEDDFLSGDSGNVAGIRASARALAADALADGLELVSGRRARLRRAASRWPERRRVLIAAIERDEVPNVLDAALAELRRSRHEVTIATSPAGGRGKFENLNRLLAGQRPSEHDWLILLDDDVRLPRGFLDCFVFVAEHLGLAIAQPAHRARSHAAWAVTRRRPGLLGRETAFVEIGPLCALHASTLPTLLPFAPLRFGWGLDAHWSALARQSGWRIGVVDATAIAHSLRPIAASYEHREAVAEARRFLAGRPYTPAVEAQRTLRAHRRLRRPPRGPRRHGGTAEAPSARC